MNLMFQKCIRSKTLDPTLVRYWLLETSNMRIFSDACPSLRGVLSGRTDYSLRRWRRLRTNDGDLEPSGGQRFPAVAGSAARLAMD